MAQGEYHIKNGFPVKCDYKVRKCPYGEHYPTKEKAQQALDKKRKAEYGIFPKTLEEKINDKYDEIMDFPNEDNKSK